MTTRKAMAAAARAAGERYFEDPKGCKRGHFLFYACNGGCVMCQGTEAKFDMWAQGMRFQGRDREIALMAWRAARQRDPVNLDSLRTRLLESPATTARLAAETGLTARHIRRMLQDIPRASPERKGRNIYWRIV